MIKLPNIAETPEVYEQHPGFDAINLRIDASLASALTWPGLEEEIAAIVEKGAKVVFEFDFDLQGSAAVFRDELAYRGIKLAVNELLKRVYPLYEKHIAAFILYRGTGDLKSFITTDAFFASASEEWARDHSLDPNYPQSKRLFSLDLLMEYLHRIGALLPDQFPQIALFQFSRSLKAAEVAALLSKERFPYIYPAVKECPVRYDGPCWEKGGGQNGFIGYQGANLPTAIDLSEPEVGLVIPPLQSLNYELLESVLKRLETSAYRLIPQSLITEMWHELDEIITVDAQLSLEGERMLQGFIAAGGVVSRPLL